MPFSQAAEATPLETSKTDAPKRVSRKEASGPTVLPVPANDTSMQAAAAAARRDSDPELNGLAKEVPPATDVKR
jgi:hypothetical protein